MVTLKSHLNILQDGRSLVVISQSLGLLVQWLIFYNKDLGLKIYIKDSVPGLKQNIGEVSRMPCFLSPECFKDMDFKKSTKLYVAIFRIIKDKYFSMWSWSLE